MVSKPRGNKDKVVMTIYLPPELRDALKHKAIDVKQSATEIVEGLIRTYVGQ